MGESKPKENDEKKRRFSQQQYEMLKSCSDKKDMTEWNEWRKRHPEKDVFLEGASLYKWYLEGVLLNQIFIDVGQIDRGSVHLEDANLGEADLRGAKLANASLENADLNGACLERAELFSTNMKYATLDDAYLEEAKLVGANLKEANLTETHLEGASLLFAHLEGAFLSGTHLEGADFGTAVVDGSTVVWGCRVDRRTDFRGVGLDSAQMDAGTKQLLKYNIRRMNWEDWYKEHWFWRWPVRWFWCLSNYGLSTWRVIIWFFGLALFFAAIYANCAYWRPPGIVENLMVEPQDPAWHYFALAVIRPIYFSVVTMTTLGFGDIYANSQSIWGHVLLTIQVILGYVLLGALVTRFAVLFTAGGPAGKFSNDK